MSENITTENLRDGIEFTEDEHIFGSGNSSSNDGETIVLEMVKDGVSQGENEYKFNGGSPGGGGGGESGDLSDGIVRFSEGEDYNLTSGSKLSALMGKIKYFFTNIAEIISDNFPTFTTEANITNTSGTPSVDVTYSDLLKKFTFSFENLKGNAGPQGVRGPAGPQGERGATGAQGPQGIQGATGAQGPAGADGEDGVGISLISYKETDASGNNIYTVTLTNGDTYDFTALRGPQGATGPQGPSGGTGAQGPAGPGVAAGGRTGEFLKKSSNADYATEWDEILQVPDGGNNGDVLTKIVSGYGWFPPVGGGLDLELLETATLDTRDSSYGKVKKDINLYSHNLAEGDIVLAVFDIPRSFESTVASSEHDFTDAGNLLNPYGRRIVVPIKITGTTNYGADGRYGYTDYFINAQEDEAHALYEIGASCVVRTSNSNSNFTVGMAIFKNFSDGAVLGSERFANTGSYTVNLRLYAIRS